MKTLYVSDLDGTLFTNEKTLSPLTIDLINKCIDNGAYFSIATARMPYGCDYKLKDLNLSIPSILTNGVFLYDFSKKTYLSYEFIEDNIACDIISCFKENNVEVFMYTYQSNQISIYYSDESLQSQIQYYSDKAIQNCGTIKCNKNLVSEIKPQSVVYFACTGEEKQLTHVKEQLSGIKGIEVAFYLNIYNGLYCLEIFSDKASKKNAIIKLKEYLSCDEIVVFGDNYNDLSMFEIADRKYAVMNALDEVKSLATETIESCNDDGVAKFISREVLKID